MVLCIMQYATNLFRASGIVKLEVEVPTLQLNFRNEDTQPEYSRGRENQCMHVRLIQMDVT